MKYLCTLFVVAILTACQAPHKQDDSLYRAFGGQAGVEALVDQAIIQIQQDPRVGRHFDATNWTRFREKQIEHMCVLMGGGCVYSGDNMIDVHGGMKITELEFNAIVDNLITAMEILEIPVSTQNRLLARMAPLRHEVIYR